MQKLLALLGAKNKEEFVELFKQFIKFGLVGVSNTAVSMAVYYIFLWISPDLYMVGSILGTILSIANAFFWNDKFVFTGNANDWRSKLKRLGKTYVSYGGISIEIPAEQPKHQLINSNPLYQPPRTVNEQAAKRQLPEHHINQDVQWRQVIVKIAVWKFPVQYQLCIVYIPAFRNGHRVGEIN